MGRQRDLLAQIVYIQQSTQTQLRHNHEPAPPVRPRRSSNDCGGGRAKGGRKSVWIRVLCPVPLGNGAAARWV